MRQELILQRNLQKALWCGRGACPTIHEKWERLRDEVIAHSRDKEVSRGVVEITHYQHNLFGYPNEERGLWLEFEGNGNQHYYEKEKAEAVYFVGCKTSFLISAHQQALGVLKELVDNGIDFAVLGPREWCCGMPLKRLGMNEEFQNCRQHNLAEIQKLEAKMIIFSCPLCHSMWQKEYMIDGIEISFWLGGKIYGTDEYGYLQNPDDWSKEVGEYLAEMTALKLTPEHWEIINIIREYYNQYQYPPYLKVIAKEMEKRWGAEKGSKRYFFKLFPDGPYNQAYKIAGVPMPDSTCGCEASLMRWHLWSKTYEETNTCGPMDTPSDPPWLQEGMEDSEGTLWQ